MVEGGECRDEIFLFGFELVGFGRGYVCACLFFGICGELLEEGVGVEVDKGRHSCDFGAVVETELGVVKMEELLEESGG